VHTGTDHVVLDVSAQKVSVYFIEHFGTTVYAGVLFNLEMNGPLGVQEETGGKTSLKMNPVYAPWILGVGSERIRFIGWKGEIGVGCDLIAFIAYLIPSPSLGAEHQHAVIYSHRLYNSMVFHPREKTNLPDIKAGDKRVVGKLCNYVWRE